MQPDSHRHSEFLDKLHPIRRTELVRVRSERRKDIYA